ncbi:MAG: RNA polymerase sigma factor [Cypionkella sp.]
MIPLGASIVQSRAVAEEVVQDTRLAVLKSIAGFESRSSLSSWIFAILINKARRLA